MNLKRRLYFGITRGLRVLADPGWDLFIDMKEEPRVTPAAQAQEQPEASGNVEQDQDPDEDADIRGAVGRESFSSPQGLKILKPVWVYIKFAKDGGFHELPLPAGSLLHIGGQRKPEWMLESTCEPHEPVKRYDEEDN